MSKDKDKSDLTEKKKGRKRLPDGEVLNDTWETPQVFMDALMRRYGAIYLDACANEHNAKCTYYIDKELNALDGTSWRTLLQNALENDNAGVDCSGRFIGPSNRVFCNPGYSNILPWCERAKHEADVHGIRTFILGHDNFCGPWFRHAVKHASEIILLYPRIQFLPPPGIAQSTNSRCSTLLIYSWRDWHGSAYIRYENWMRW